MWKVKLCLFDSLLENKEYFSWFQFPQVYHKIEYNISQTNQRTGDSFCLLGHIIFTGAYHENMCCFRNGLRNGLVVVVGLQLLVPLPAVKTLHARCSILALQLCPCQRCLTLELFVHCQIQQWWLAGDFDGWLPPSIQLYSVYLWSGKFSLLVHLLITFAAIIPPSHFNKRNLIYSAISWGMWWMYEFLVLKCLGLVCCWYHSALSTLTGYAGTWFHRLQ